MEEDAYKEIKKQIDKLSRMHPDSADANLIQGYLDWVIEIPFGKIFQEKSGCFRRGRTAQQRPLFVGKTKERIEEFLP